MKHIAVDFAQTLIEEQPMIQWVLFEIRNKRKSTWKRIMFMISSFARGAISMIFGRYSVTSQWAVRTAYMAFKDLDEVDLRQFINYNRDKNYILNLNNRLLNVIEMLKENEKVANISIHSQGTCLNAIKLFLQREDVKAKLGNSGIRITGIKANQLETRSGKFTGHIIPPIITKHNKHLTLPQNCIFIGDNKDEKAVGNLKTKEFKFINYTKP